MSISQQKMNCIIIDDDELSRIVIENFIEKVTYLNHVGSFKSPIEAIDLINTRGDIDLVFLDIEMPEMTGLEFLQSIKSLPQIIIISGKKQYALDAFEYDVTDYVLKPVTYPRMFKAVEKANKRFRETKKNIVTDDGFFIKTNSSLVRIKHEEILWVEALENYVGINTFDNKFTIHSTMKAIEERLPMGIFKRVHRSFIVNINKIAQIEDNLIIIKVNKGIKSIPIGKSYREALMEVINLVNL
jgi:DNA-binding LytR/AlgR family response regulator